MSYNISDIQYNFNKVITYSQGIYEPKTDDLFNKWASAKQKWIERFGNELIVEYPEKVHFTIAQESKNKLFNNFVDYVVCKTSWNDTYDVNEFLNFVKAQEKGFFDNRVVQEYHYNGVTISEGMKLGKSFKYFFEDDIELQQIQMKASEYVQQSKLEGILCFSVHPLDYLSLSENNYSWRSCHALDGDYRAGNLAYMAQSNNIICYIRGDENQKLERFPEDVPWNSKKWRMLLYFSDTENVLYAGRQYPFVMADILNELVDKYLKALIPALSHYGNWYDRLISSYKDRETNGSYALSEKYLPLYGKLVPFKKIIQEEKKSPLYYNDLLFSTCYEAKYTTRFFIEENDFTCTMKNPHCKCLQCGEAEITESEFMRCNECECKYGIEPNDLFEVCAYCGARGFAEDYYSIGDDGICYCSRCFDRYCFTCDSCNVNYSCDDACYDEDTGGTYCPWCMEDLRESRKLRNFEEREYLL